MKSSFCFSAVSGIAMAFTGCTKQPDIHVAVVLDAQKRPKEVFSYVVGTDGAKIKHGESVTYDWVTEVVRRERYELGHLQSGDFETSANANVKSDR
jgi:hypothetical protein